MLGLGAASASAQDGFDINYMDVGPVIGVGGINGAGFSVGGRFEKAIREIPAANGILGLSVGVDYYNFDNDVPFFGTFDFTVIPISVLVNYHFAIPSQPKLDVFAGAGLGYQRWSFDCSENVFGVNFCDDLDGGVRSERSTAVSGTSGGPAWRPLRKSPTTQEH